MLSSKLNKHARCIRQDETGPFERNETFQKCGSIMSRHQKLKNVVYGLGALSGTVVIFANVLEHFYGGGEGGRTPRAGGGSSSSQLSADLADIN